MIEFYDTDIIEITFKNIFKRKCFTQCSLTALTTTNINGLTNYKFISLMAQSSDYQVVME